MEFSFTSAFGMVFSAVEAAFQWQGSFWDQFGVFPTFILAFVVAAFFRLIVFRMLFGGEGVGADAAVRDFHARQDKRIKEINRMNGKALKASRRKGKKK